MQPRLAFWVPGPRHRGAWLRGYSDTEMLLAAIDAWGIEAAITQAAGMFAIAI